jgi:hypothetical protein
MTPYPGHEWMEQQARNATMEEWGFLRGCRYLLYDRDTKFCASFRERIESGSNKTIRLPARSPNWNSFAERWVRSVKEECLSRNHQGKENLILFPLEKQKSSGAVSGAAWRSAEVLRARGRVGVEVGTTGHVWQFSYTYKDACSLAQAKGLPSLIYH